LVEVKLIGMAMEKKEQFQAKHITIGAYDEMLVLISGKHVEHLV
jgi:hypothetical protein